MAPGAYLIRGDARAIPLADGSVQCVVTSPPYWGLRDYGVADQLGLEPTPDLYVAHMVEVFREVRRVLRADGTCWLNLGDSYAANWNSQRDEGGGGFKDVTRARNKYPPPGLKPKDLCGIPWRVAFALQADGWWLRSDIIWSKPNPMPESITDRPTKAHEYLFLLTKSARYYYDAEAIREPHATADTDKRYRLTPEEYESAKVGSYHAHASDAEQGQQQRKVNGFRVLGNPAGRNRRSVWTIATEPYPEAHFATFPEKVVEPCILAGTSERGACPTCGAPWGREVEPSEEYAKKLARANDRGDWYERVGTVEKRPDGTKHGKQEGGIRSDYRTTGWSPSCACPPADPVPCRVFDPFAGSGTTVAVAERLGRVGIGLELKPVYLALARRRTVQMGLL